MRRKQHPVRSILAVCLLLSSGIYAESTCKKGCPQSDSGLLKYTAGNVYEYNFDSIMTVGLKTGATAADTDDTSLKIVGNAKVFAEGNCGYTLQLNAVKISTTKEVLEKKLVQSIQKPIHFTLVGGKLEPELCADPSDNIYSLNVKRAVISLFQSNTDATDSTETDVFGQCPTHTTVSKLDKAEVVTKVRNLNHCAYREKINSGLISGIVNEKSGLRSAMIFQADYAKEVEIVNGVIGKVHLAEEYRFAGAPKEGANVRAKVITSLKLKNPSGAPAPPPATGAHGVSVIFQTPEAYATKNIAALKAAVSEIVQSTDNYVQKDSAKKFVELIRLMRHADTNTLLELAAAPHPNKVLARKVYLDALFRTGTADSAKAIMKQLPKMEDKERIIALLSLNAVQHVDKDLLNQAAALVTGNAAKEVFLAVGNLVSKYCNDNNGCEQSDIEPISKRFSDVLRRCEANNKKAEERIVYILKGIGNTKHLASNVAGTLNDCAAPGRSMRIRVAALQAYTAASCEPALKSKALELLRNRSEDSELRIEAYLAATECPDAEVANQIADIVNSETVYQVGGFITSHLKAIRDSTDATREQQRQYLSSIHVTKQFPIDLRRYSYNNEISYKLAALGLSSSADYKLIYSQHGFLPRSARLNVTSEVFGTNFNIFEASVRQENLEDILEYYLGPKGLRNRELEEILNKLGTSHAGGAAGRSRRSIADETSNFAKKYKNYGVKNIQDLNLDMSLKLFGSEMLFLSLGDNIPSTVEELVDALSKVFDGLKKQLSSFNKEFVVHNLFMDIEYMYATGIGIPMHLVAQGFAANKLEVGLGIDVESILRDNYKRAKYRVKLVPSVDVNVHLQVGFNAYVLGTGMRVSSSAHSAVGSDVNFNFIDDGNGFNMDIDLPREKIELIDLQIKPDFYIAEQDKEIKSLPFKSNKKHHAGADGQDDCFNQLQSLGFDFCYNTNVELTKLPVAQAGAGQSATAVSQLLQPTHFSLYVKSERKLNLKGRHITKPNNEGEQWKLEFSTPGSKQPHDTSLSLELGAAARIYARLAFDTTDLHMALETGITNDNKELVLYGQYEKNNEVTKNKIGFSKNGNEYRPLIQVKDKDGNVVDNINGYRADGRIVVQPVDNEKARYNFENFQVMNKKNERLVLNGWVDLGKGTLNSELHVAAGSHAYQIKNEFSSGAGNFVAGFFLNDERQPDNVIGASANVKYANQDVSVKVIGKIATWEIENVNEFSFVKPEDSKEITSTKFNHEFSVKRKQSLIALFKLNGLTEKDKKLKFNAELKQDKNIAALSVNINANQRAEGDYLIEVNTRVNKQSVDLLAKCDISGNRYVIDNTLKTSWGTSLTAKGELGQRYSPQDIYIDLQGDATFAAKEQPTHWTLKIVGAPEKTTSEFKLQREKAELIKFTAETQHPQDKLSAGKINLILKNALHAKAEFKIAKNGKGELSASVDTQNAADKHKLEITSKFLVQAPKLEIEVKAVLDETKELNFKTENVLDKTKFTTKNSIEGTGLPRTSFDANGSVKGEWRANGEVHADFKLQTPDKRIIDGTFKRKITTNPKTGAGDGNLEFTINDQLPNQQKRSLVVNSKADKINLKTKEYSQTAQIQYKHFTGKQLELNLKVNAAIKDASTQTRKLDLSTTLSGDLVNLPFNVVLSISEYSPKHAIYSVNGKVAEYVVADVSGNYRTGERAQPATYELNVQMQLPQTNFKTIEVKTHGKYLKAQSDAVENCELELHLTENIGSEHFSRFNLNLHNRQHQRTYKLDVHTNKMPTPLELHGTYQHEPKQGDSNGKQKQDFNLSYNNKYIKVNSDVDYSNDAAKMHFVVESSFEAAKNIDLTVNAQKLDGQAGYAVQVSAKIQPDKIYEVNAKIYRGAHKKGLDIHAKLPSGQPVVLVGIFELLGERKAKLVVQIEHLLDLDLNASTEASYKGMDDFYILAQWNSAKLQLNNYDLQIRSQGKDIKISLKHAQGVVFSGSATYTLKKEKNKAIVEGQGQLQYHGKSHNTNFRLIRQIYDLDNDKEIGFSYNFNGNLGPKNGVFTLKLTNKEHNTKLSVCEEKKQCTNIQIQSTISVDEQPETGETLQHAFLILFDLRELGYPYEFEYSSNTIRQGFKVQYSLKSKIISNNNLVYQLIANVVPKSSKLTLKLPKREIVFETQQQWPEHGKVFGHYENSAAFYFDKVKRPNDVTRLLATADISGIERVSVNAKSLLKLEHPKIRPLTISGKFDANRNKQIVDTEVIFDIFRLPEQQIIATSHLENSEPNTKGFNITSNQSVRSSGLAFQYELSGHVALNAEREEFTAATSVQTGSGDLKASGYIFGNTERFEAIIYALNEQVLQLNGEYTKDKAALKLDGKVHLFEQKAVEFSSEIQHTNAKFTAKRDGLLNAVADINFGKQLKFSVVDAAGGKQLLNGHIGLDDKNFLDTVYESNENDIKAFLDRVEAEMKRDTEETRQRIKDRLQKLRQTIDTQVQLAKDSTPDFEPLKANYEENVNEIIKELESDPTLKQLSETYHKLYDKLAKIASDTAKTAAESFEQIHKSFVALYEKLQVLLKDTIIPAWEELMVPVSKALAELRYEIIKLHTSAMKSALGALKEYGGVIKAYYAKLSTANKALNPIYEQFKKYWKVLTGGVQDLYNWIKDKLPSTLENIHKEFELKLKELKLGEKLKDISNDIYEHLYVLPLPQEAKDFLDKLHQYMQSKLQQQAINDEKLLEELYVLFVKAVRAAWANIVMTSPTTAAGASATGFTSWIASLPSSADVLAKLPGLLTFRFSGINYLLNENWESLLSKEHLKTWLLFQDFELKGHVADGHHIFTFDGQYITLPGTCKYILAQDSVDNNFTVVAQLNNGKLKSVTLTDRDGHFMEINDAGVLKLNGKPAEYPQHNSDTGMHAWRKFYVSWLLSEYGVEVMCTNDLKVCHVHVNGFYTSKTRGLLGNGNAEPNDDYVQPDGTLAADYATFGNAYGLGKCNAVAVTPVPQHAEVCNEVLGLTSPLALWYIALDVTPYRAACDVAVAAAAEKDKEAAACNIALAYGSALKANKRLVMLPERCLKCTGAVGQRDLGQEFTVKVPNTKADIVFVVDVAVSPAVLANLVAPTINEVRDTLKARGFTDVQVGVIAYNDSQIYPALLTSDNGKINYHGNLADLQLTGPKKFGLESLKENVVDKQILEVYQILENIIRSVVPQADEKAFVLALDYPFRAGAAKSIVGVRSNTLNFNNVLKLIRAHIADAVTDFDAAILHLIGPVKDMSLEGVPAEKLIGFNQRLVATLDGKDPKKRPKLKFNNDMGIDFALNNGGWVFATQNFDALKPQDQKKALNQVTNSIADTLFKTEIVSDCRCWPVHGLHAQHKCTIKSSSFVPSKKVKGTA